MPYLKTTGSIYRGGEGEEGIGVRLCGLTEESLELFEVFLIEEANIILFLNITWALLRLLFRGRRGRCRPHELCNQGLFSFIHLFHVNVPVISHSHINLVFKLTKTNTTGLILRYLLHETISQSERPTKSDTAPFSLIWHNLQYT